ncbi:protein of unknown function [Candidatus Filomicrobium marinum]|uniref:Uncharacterized protein n=1 Tax=Candidatus Filomicrobium marinum TaxID=1608628 RepID=A0A0D6JEG3_9HYPH|nr:protein of unknown function [Candidatus Filomicrobium marinum]CPR18073.1 protein of unknown function [Candidatus Filomicrobium marinum]
MRSKTDAKLTLQTHRVRTKLNIPNCLAYIPKVLVGGCHNATEPAGLLSLSSLQVFTFDPYRAKHAIIPRELKLNPADIIDTHDL